MDPNQTKLTDYYQLLEKIEVLISSNSECSEIINQASNLHKERLAISHPELEVSCLLKQLLENIKNNSCKIPQAKRHDHIIKIISISLLVYAGPRAYNFLHENIPNGLPCLCTVQRIIRSEYKPMNEGEFLFDDLLIHLNNYKAH